MPNLLNVLLGHILYTSHEVNENAAPTITAAEADALNKISIKLTHDKKEGHIIDIKVNQGFVRKNTNDIILTVQSETRFKITPYDDDFFKKPAKMPLIELVAQIAQKACDHNRGMFVIIREDYGMNEAIPVPIPDHQMRSLIFNDINKQLLN